MDFAQYRSVLKNQAVIDEIEQAMKNFKPATYDVSKQIKAIEAFEVQAVKNAQETKGLVDKELVDLEKTLKNIQQARPLEDLTVVRIAPSDAAVPTAVGSDTRSLIDSFDRTMSWQRSPRSRSAPLNSFRRVGGPFLVTRRNSATSLFCDRVVHTLYRGYGDIFLATDLVHA